MLQKPQHHYLEQNKIGIILHDSVKAASEDMGQFVVFVEIALICELAVGEINSA